MRRALARRTGRILLAVGLLAGGLTACVSVQGVGEFEAYQSAFGKAYTLSTSILDQLAVQERLLSKNSLRYTPGSNKFDPSQAAIFSDQVDPPGTAAFRRSLDTVKAYNDLLYGLESGQTAGTLTAKLTNLETNVAAAASDVTGLLNFAGKPLIAGLQAAFAAFTPAVKMSLTLRSRQEFRQYLMQNYEPVRAILLELKAGTSVVFPILTFTDRAGARSITGTGKLSSDEIAKIEAVRKLLSDWVILLDASAAALAQAKSAVEAPPTLAGSVTGMTDTVVQLDAVAVAARKDLAALSTH